MNTNNNLEQELDRLGEQITSQPSIVDAVMRRVEAMKAVPVRSVHQLGRIIMKGTMALAASILVGIAVWFGCFSRPATLYAQVMAAMDEVKSLRVTGEHYGQGQWQKAYEVWYEAGVGAAQLEWKGDQLKPVRVDDGRYIYEYRETSPKPIRSRGGDPKRLIAKVLCIRERHPAWIRESSGDLQIAAGAAMMYQQFTSDGRSRYRIWLDAKDRVIRFEQHRLRDGQWLPDEQSVVQYDVPIDRQFWARYVPQKAEPDTADRDADRLLNDLFGLDKAIATKEAFGLTFAVHELQRVEGGRLLLLVSLRPSEATLRNVGPFVESELPPPFRSWGDFSLVPYGERLVGGDYMEESLAIADVAEIAAGGVHAYWYILEPQGDWAADAKDLHLSGYVHTRNKLEQAFRARQQDWYGQFHPLLTLPLPKAGPLPTLEEAIDRTYADATALEAADLQPVLWEAGHRQADGTTAVRTHRPQELSAEDFQKECRAKLAAGVESYRQWARENASQLERMHRRTATQVSESQPAAP